MVFLSNADGTIVKTISSQVHQGATYVNEVVLAGPFAGSCTVTAHFRTPNGITLSPQVMAKTDGGTLIAGVDYNAWTCLLSAPVTELSGDVTVMFMVTPAGQGTGTPARIVTVPTNFQVVPGVYIAPPEEPAADLWTEIVAAISTVSGKADDNANAIKALQAKDAAIETDVEGIHTDIDGIRGDVAGLETGKLDKVTTETENAMVYAKTPEGEQQMLPFPDGTIANLQDGEGTASIRQVGNKALGPHAVALGNNNVVGQMGYYIQAVSINAASNTSTFYLGQNQKNPLIERIIPVDSAFTAPNWSVGDFISVVNNKHFDIWAQITDINHNVVTVNRNMKADLNFSTLSNIGIDDNSIYVPAKPLSGVVSLVLAGYSEGISNISTGNASHAEGGATQAIGDYAHAEGRNTLAVYSAHAEGRGTQARALCSHAEGFQTTTNGQSSHAEGENTVASITGAHAEGLSTKAGGNGSHAEGYKTQALGAHAHAEGAETLASGYNSHAEGGSATREDGGETITAYSTASATDAHAEGAGTTASGVGSHAEGYFSVASGGYAHAEGYSEAKSWQSHAENIAKANAIQSHAEGSSVTQSGAQFAHAEGEGNTATGRGQHVGGRFSRVGYDALGNQAADSNFLVRIGNGTADGNRSNAFTIDTSGTATMIAAQGSTAAISLPSHFITKEYADAHYGGGGGATYTKASVGVSMWFAGDSSILYDMANSIPDLSQDGFFYFTDYGGNVKEYSITYLLEMIDGPTCQFVLPPFSTYQRQDYQPPDEILFYNYMFPNYYDGGFTQQDGKYRFDGVIYYIKKKG